MLIELWSWLVGLWRRRKEAIADGEPGTAAPDDGAAREPTIPTTLTKAGWDWRSLPHLVFAWICYLFFVRSMVYLIGFVGNFSVPRTIDTVVVVTTTGEALLINALLVLAFATHHSVFARTGAKVLLKRIAPPIVERSIYVLASSLLLILLMWQWRALPAPVWVVHSPVLRGFLWAVFASGWGLATLSSMRLGHSETFGVRQVLRLVQRRVHVARGVEHRAMYGVIRHPMYLGFLIGVWVTPSMSLGHLELAVLLTSYVLFGRRLEERDLGSRFGPEYRDYRDKVPGFFPRRGDSG